ncbi:MAG TPA: PrpR N-terminal domain-containing protein [Candidatus Scatomonas pullistercoris]|uniref:PrpR N-terminal domain-containing protein n=1 Tax=Candidatus Scatomonas pullistercoris TaxID=2840920 RepID=A0A9D1P340_9FIRM|nr:PrpR N-terminal domain-containing protein [Candidatus Scatomonas pullistercoris]
MAKQLASVVKEFPDIELTIHVGDREEGIRLAQENYHSNYDMILSRGGTATLLHSTVSLPIIEIETSAYDILSILKLAYLPSQKTAILGYPNITKKFKAVCSLLDYDIALYEIDSEENLNKIFADIVEKKFETIIGDVAGYTAAHRFGIRSYLITSSDESIRQAFKSLSTFYQMNQQLTNDNQFFKTLLQSKMTNTIVLALDGRLIYTNNTDNNTQSLLQILREKLHVMDFSENMRLHFQTQNTIYKVYTRTVTDKENTYIAFDYTVSRVIKNSQSGINYYNADEIEKIYAGSIYGRLGISASYLDQLHQLSKLENPVFLTGEYGLGKSYFAMLLYLKSPYTSSTYVHINSDLIDDKSWSFLIENHRSPLCGTDSTICFSDVDSLSENRQTELLSYILASQVFKHNRVIFSFSESPDHEITEIAMHYKNKLHCDAMSLTPLRDNPEAIKNMATLYLNWLNIHGDKAIHSFAPAALDLLSAYSWPQNFFQFQKVLNSSYSNAPGDIISESTVQIALTDEKKIVTISSGTNESAHAAIDLTESLEEITQKIVKQVLENCGGNHTQTARSLKISRATLWRMLKESS